MSPEVIKCEKPCFKLDVYAFGILMWGVLSEKILYEDYLTEDGDPLTPFQIKYKVSAEDLRPDLNLLNEETPKQFKLLLQSCWDTDRAKRPNIDNVVNSLRELVIRC